ncbi:hypothetical protein [uncultured Kordia sp.]|uniref:hypothetical protein n=1 Tax=uncultured Kordia sp. TaxID=507699 RepID=UPI002630D469|nr:hypothetical protein [uncultured Kordia sp.]
MKKSILLVIIVLTTMISYAQSDLEKDAAFDQNTSNVTYKIFPTKNMWNFIKLNTKTGQMWQVQFDVNGKDRFQTDLNILPLVIKEKQVDNRFTLYPTQNTWTFILLDQIDGNTWQVQWAIKSKDRMVIPIK